MFDRSGSYCCGCYIVDHYCLRFDRGVVHIETSNSNGQQYNSQNNMNHSIKNQYCLRFNREVVHIVVASYIVDHDCLMFDRGVVHIVVAGYIVDQYCLIFDRVVHKTSNSNSQQYNSHNNKNHSCQTSNGTGKQYNSHNNMNHSSVKH
jgi:hypothetical protein